jgi:GAF domain-containing protein
VSLGGAGRGPPERAAARRRRRRPGRARRPRVLDRARRPAHRRPRLRGGGPELLGAHFRADQGIAGHVVQTGRPLTIDDLAREPRFAHDIAVETGYAPEALYAAPISLAGTVVGVLSVLDPGRPPPGGAIAVLEALCAHTAVALTLSDALGDPKG